MNVFSMLRHGAAATLVAGAVLAGVTRADAVTIDFSYDSGATTVVTLGGAGPATLNFTLDFGAQAGQSVLGDFTMEVQNKDGVTISLVELLGLSFDQAGSLNFGDTTLPANFPVFDISFANLITWSVDLTPDDLSPVTLLIKATLTPDFAGFQPVLSLAIDGDAQVTPIPGALPLFVTGLGALVLVAKRRKRRQQA